jgi:hypothetical protein
MWVVAAATVFVAVIISWQAYRCHTDTDKCKAYPAIQISTPFDNSIADTSVEEEKSQNEAAGACADAHGYLCLILTPANLPTIYLVILGLGGIIVAIGSLGVIERQTHVAEQNLIIASRAFLSVGGEPEKAESGEVRIPIENRGRVPAKILAVEITVLIHQFIDGKYIEIFRRSMKADVRDEVIVPGDPHFSLFAHLPEIAKDTTCHQITVAGDVKYDTGFNNTSDVLKFTRTFPVKYKVWMKVWNAVWADFRETPETEKQTDTEKKNPN